MESWCFFICMFGVIAVTKALSYLFYCSYVSGGRVQRHKLDVITQQSNDWPCGWWWWQWRLNYTHTHHLYFHIRLIAMFWCFVLCSVLLTVYSCIVWFDDFKSLSVNILLNSSASMCILVCMSCMYVHVYHCVSACVCVCICVCVWKCKILCTWHTSKNWLKSTIKI